MPFPALIGRFAASVNSTLPSRGAPPLGSSAMGSDHYFSATPASPENLRRIRVTLAGRDLEVTTAGGVFSPDHVDSGTAVLLSNTPPPPAGGNFLDLGCGWGPIALSLALDAAARDRVGRRRERTSTRPRAAQRRRPRARQCQRRAARRCSRRHRVPHDPLEPAHPRRQERAARPARAMDPAPRRAGGRLAGGAAQSRVGLAAALARRRRWIAGSASTAPRRRADSVCSRCGATARRRASRSRCPSL